jgi:hypothetical protein
MGRWSSNTDEATRGRGKCSTGMGMLPSCP